MEQIYMNAGGLMEAVSFLQASKHQVRHLMSLCRNVNNKLHPAMITLDNLTPDYL